MSVKGLELERTLNHLTDQVESAVQDDDPVGFFLKASHDRQII
ncbi:MAG: hypothetical protein V3T42_04500 [Nitrospirales bacterium]